MQPRRGTTLIEQIVVLTVLGLLAGLVFRSVRQSLDSLAVHGASRELRDAFAAAREHAVAGGQRTAVHIDAARAEFTVHADRDTIVVRPVGALHGVTVRSSRDSMAYSPSGLGYGAANLQVILTRGSSAETVTVSRLGRVR